MKLKYIAVFLLFVIFPQVAVPAEYFTDSRKSNLSSLLSIGLVSSAIKSVVSSDLPIEKVVATTSELSVVELGIEALVENIRLLEIFSNRGSDQMLMAFILIVLGLVGLQSFFSPLNSAQESRRAAKESGDIDEYLYATQREVDAEEAMRSFGGLRKMLFWIAIIAGIFLLYFGFLARKGYTSVRNFESEELVGQFVDHPIDEEINVSEFSIVDGLDLSYLASFSPFESYKTIFLQAHYKPGDNFLKLGIGMVLFSILFIALNNNALKLLSAIYMKGIRDGKNIQRFGERHQRDGALLEGIAFQASGEEKIDKLRKKTFRNNLFLVVLLLIGLQLISYGAKKNEKYMKQFEKDSIELERDSSEEGKKTKGIKDAFGMNRKYQDHLSINKTDLLSELNQKSKLTLNLFIGLPFHESFLLQVMNKPGSALLFYGGVTFLAGLFGLILHNHYSRKVHPILSERMKIAKRQQKLSQRKRDDGMLLESLMTQGEIEYESEKIIKTDNLIRYVLWGLILCGVVLSIWGYRNYKGYEERIKLEFKDQLEGLDNATGLNESLGREGESLGLQDGRDVYQYTRMGIGTLTFTKDTNEKNFKKIKPFEESQENKRQGEKLIFFLSVITSIGILKIIFRFHEFRVEHGAVVVRPDSDNDKQIQNLELQKVTVGGQLVLLKSYSNPKVVLHETDFYRAA